MASQKEQLVSQKKQLEIKDKQLEQQEKELQELRRMLAEKNNCMKMGKNKTGATITIRARLFGKYARTGSKNLSAPS